MKARILGNLLTILWDSPAVLGDTSVSYAVACDGYSAMNVQQKYIQVTVHSSQAGNFLRCQVSTELERKPCYAFDEFISVQATDICRESKSFLKVLALNGNGPYSCLCFRLVRQKVKISSNCRARYFI